MGTITDTAAEAFRDYVTTGVPASGAYEPEKSDIRALFASIEATMGTLSLGSVDVTKSTRALLDADLAWAADSIGLVYADATDANNDLYIKVGASGAGSWTLTTALHDVITAVAQPYLTAAKAAQAAAESAAAIAQAVLASQRQDRWHTMLSELAARNVPRGLITLTDYGITDYPNPFALLFFWTGAVLYPLRKVDGTFQAGWADGDIRHIAPNGDFYRSVSVPKMYDPTLDPALTITNYHVDPITGTDDTAAGRGASQGDPWKSLDYAIGRAKVAGTPSNIFFYGDKCGINSLNNAGSGMTISDNMKIKVTFVPATLPLTWIVPMRENLTKANFAWQSVGSGTWKTAAAGLPIPDAVKKTFAMADFKYLDEDGCPLPYRYLGAAGSDADTQTAIKAMPGSFGWFGTTDTGLNGYVHTIDGREPDPAEIFHVEGSQLTTWSIGEGAVLFLENVGKFAWDQGTNISGIRVRPISVVDVDVQVDHTGQFWMHNFASVGASGCGVQVYDLGLFGWDYGAIKYCYQDGENIHSFYANTSNAGDNMVGWSSFVKIDYCGYTTFGNPPAAGLSNQISSVHDKARFTRSNMIGARTTGAVIADVLGAQTWSFNVHAADPTQGPGHGPAGDNTGSPEVAFWSDGAIPAGVGATKMRLWNCSGKVPAGANIFSATNNGVIDHAKHIGAVTSETASGGSVVAVG